MSSLLATPLMVNHAKDKNWEAIARAGHNNTGLKVCMRAVTECSLMHVAMYTG
jgi:hypothetical protein